MNRPTHEEIEDFIKGYGKSEFVFTDCIESWRVKFYGKFKDSDAESFSKQVNNRFGQWIHSSYSFMWRDYSSVSISYRSEELSKCPYCGCLDGMHNYCPVVVKCSICKETKLNCVCGNWNITKKEAE